mgnify:CR=1 FL=1
MSDSTGCVKFFPTDIVIVEVPTNTSVAEMDFIRKEFEKYIRAIVIRAKVVGAVSVER